MKVYLKGSFIFSLIILFFLLTFIYLSTGFDFNSKIVPLIIMLPTVALLIIILIADLFPALAVRFEVDMFKASSSNSRKNEKKVILRRKDFLITSLWLISFFLLILFFGFLIAIPICLTTFLKFYRHTWLQTVTITLLTWAFVYVLFQIVIKFELFKGIIFGALV